MKWYRNFLYGTCNPTSGQWWWYVVLMIGFVGVTAWIIAALPFCATWFDLPSIGAFGKDEFIIYGVLHLSSKAFEYYFFTIFFSIVLAKFFYLVLLLGMNYSSGYIYLPPRVSGHPLGIWVKQ